MKKYAKRALYSVYMVIALCISFFGMLWSLIVGDVWHGEHDDSPWWPC